MWYIKAEKIGYMHIGYLPAQFTPPFESAIHGLKIHKNDTQINTKALCFKPSSMVEIHVSNDSHVVPKSILRSHMTTSQLTKWFPACFVGYRAGIQYLSNSNIVHLRYTTLFTTANFKHSGIVKQVRNSPLFSHLFSLCRLMRWSKTMDPYTEVRCVYFKVHLARD